MTDSSDCESDAGASPSVSSDESSSSSRCSSPNALRIVTPSTSRRKTVSIVTPSTGGVDNDSSFTSTTPGTSFSAVSENCSTPLSSGRRPPRRRQISTPITPASSIKTSANSSCISILRSGASKGSLSDTNRTPASSSSSAVVTPTLRKRKRPASKVFSSPEHSDHHANQHGHGEDPNLSSPEKKRKRNKRRRTRSERNLLAGKTTTTPVVAQVVAEGEGAVALDAEIDRVLEEKAIKNNLSATNVKSILRHVISNNMVQKMIMSEVKRKAENGGNAGGSSDEDGLLGPKMTRAKTKELMGSKQIPLWAIVDSPVKKSKKPVSETHMLIHNDLPEDSSGDEEYVPKETDISEIVHSDDESSIASSHTSDIGSPAVPIKQRVSTRRSVQAERSPFVDTMFKTPPPRPNAKTQKQNQADSGISRRTRSKLPLNDTPLEDLERQLVPPDITKDMYDWDTQTDNEDYLSFLKDFLNPGHSSHNDANEMDDDADPEYNVMEDVEDVHDKEELRMDRAVKVPKKELTQLIAELFEPGGMLSGDDIDLDHDLATLTGITPLVNDSGFTDSAGRLADTSMNSTAQELQTSTVDASVIDISNSRPPAHLLTPQAQETGNAISSLQSEVNLVLQEVIVNGESTKSQEILTSLPITQSTDQTASTGEANHMDAIVHAPPYFRECDLSLLKHQMRQHLQLLTQSYVLTVSTEDACLKSIARAATTMVNEIKNFTKVNGSTSCFSVCNLESAWTLVNFWPYKFLNQSPIKKKILEVKYISDSGIATNNEGKPKGNYFPRHVVKCIAEHNAFIYNSLLPECYNQRNTLCRTLFSFHEDALIVGAMDEVRELKLSARHIAEQLHEVLLKVHPTAQLYNRIRNLRRSNPTCDPNIKKYFTEGILPEPDRTVPELTEDDMKPLIQRDRRGLTSLWTSLLVHIEDSPREKWEEKLSKDPITKCCEKKWNKAFSKRPSRGPSSFDKAETINRVFGNGSLIVDTPNPHYKSIPILAADGSVGAMINIPRLALVVHPMVQQPKEGEEAEKRISSTEVRLEPQQPREGEEAKETAQLCHPQQVASKSNTNLQGLEHARRPGILRTPVKLTGMTILSPKEDSPTKKVDFKLPVPPTPRTVIADTAAYSVYQVVGKPFDLPELDGTSGAQVIDLSSLQTPVKRKIFERVAEQTEEEQVPLSDSVNEKFQDTSPEKSENCDEEENPDSPNVIMEGTEVELTSDEDDEFVDSLRCDEKPELISLSSDEDSKLNCSPKTKQPGIVSLSSDDEGKGYSNPVSVIVKNSSRNGGGGGGGNSPPKKSENSSGGGGSSTKNSTNSTPSTINNSNGSSASRKSGTLRAGGDGKGEDSDEDGERKATNRKRTLPKDHNGDDDHQEKDKDKQQKRAQPQPQPQSVMQAPPPPAVPGTHTASQAPPPTQVASSSSAASVNKHVKKPKRSPGCPAGNKSRVSSKYNVTPPERMLEETSEEYEDVSDAYMEAYLARVQSVTEANHPGTYASFTQLLVEFGEGSGGNKKELHSKVRALFKDYPELIQEFESILNDTITSSYDVTSTHGDAMAEINLIQMVEKYTEHCPALKAKIMNKWKSLKEKPNFTSKDFATALEPFFTGNPVIMEAFKAVLPSVYRPQSVSQGMDFEVIELDMEDPLQQKGGGGDFSSCAANSEDVHYEIVKLPDETQVPATSTCPCVCHANTSDPVFASRSKHCRKCSLKFQEGKIFIHNGKVMRPVSVELTSPAALNKIPQPTSSASIRNAPPPSSSHHHDSRVNKKESHDQQQHHHNLHHPPLPPAPSHHQKTATVTKPKEVVKKDQMQEICVVRPSSSSAEKRFHGHTQSQSVFQAHVAPSSSTSKLSSTTSKELAVDSGVAVAHKPQQTQQQQLPPPPKQDKDLEWTEDEDRVILAIWKQEIPKQMMWKKINSQIPHRTVDQLKRRYAEMVEIFKTENLNDSDGPS